tara:strand:+ start:392 stop:601 length:210 start_codon:yes stop_codon:yes gene_type:complete
VKEAEKQVKYWENELSQKDMKTEYLRPQFEAQLESAKKDYKVEKFTYDAIIGTLTIAVVLIIIIAIKFI